MITFARKTVLLLLPILVAYGVLLGAENPLGVKVASFDTTVEVAPDTFITFSRFRQAWELKHKSFAAVHMKESERAKYYQKDISFLSIPVEGEKPLVWVGVGIPISLRLHNGKMHMITFDRDTDFSKIRFRYYMEDHATLREVRPAEYPKAVAIQNLWLSKKNGYRDGKPVNEYDIVRQLNPEGLDFPSSLTAKIWHQLEKGVEYYEVRDERIDKSFLETYIKDNRVIRLNKIIKD